MQFLYPGFLIGLLAVAVPVLLHLLQLRRPQRVVFTNTSVIRQVALVTTRQRKVQQWLVLLARVVAVAALVLVFCQPFLPVTGGEKLEGGIDVIVDNSFSMQVPTAANGSLVEGALEGARQVGNAVGNGERLRLLNVGTGVLTKTGFANKLQSLRAGGRVRGLLMASSADETSQHALYVFSDFQKNTFSGQQLEKLRAGQQVVLVPLKGQPVANIYIDSVWVDDAFVRVRANVGLHVRLRNGGSVAATDCPVKVFLGNRQAAAFRTTVQPGQAVTTVVQVQLADAQLALGRVVTEDAPVMFDNAFYFTLQPAAAIGVLEIGTEPVAQQVYGNEPLFTYQFMRTQAVEYGALRQANLVLLDEVAAVDAGLREALRAVVQRGATVVVVPSAVVAARASYLQLFREVGLGAVQWEDAAARPELREVAMPSAREPFFRDVFGARARAVTMPRAAPVLRWSRTGTDVLRLRDGESYLAEFESGPGRVYVFSAPFANGYSDFPAHALFVPVLYRMAMLSYRNEQQAAYQLTQRTLRLQLPPATDAGARADEAGFRLVQDSLTLVPGQRVVGSEVHLDLPESMTAPGFYQVRRQGRALTTLAFNPDKRESELAAYSAEELRALVGPNRPNVRVVEAGPAGVGLAGLRASRTGTPLWRYCLTLALAALLAEALLLRFGRRRAGVGLATAVA